MNLINIKTSLESPLKLGIHCMMLETCYLIPAHSVWWSSVMGAKAYNSCGVWSLSHDLSAHTVCVKWKIKCFFWVIFPLIKCTRSTGSYYVSLDIPANPSLVDTGPDRRGRKNLKPACLLLSQLDQSGLRMSDMSETHVKRLASVLEQLIDPCWPDSRMAQKQAHIIECIPIFTLRTRLFVLVLAQGPESVLQAVQEKKLQICFITKKQGD